MRRSAPFAVIAVLAVPLAGCATVEQTYPGHDEPVVWAALVDAAEAPATLPEPPALRWHIEDNQVLANDRLRHVEIRRRLARWRNAPGARPRLERKDVVYHVRLAEDDGAPVVRFRGETALVPAWTWQAAERYFSTVDALLGQAPPRAFDTAPPDDDDFDALELDDSMPDEAPLAEPTPEGLIDVEDLEP